MTNSELQQFIKKFNQVSQLSHVGFGLSVILLSNLIGGGNLIINLIILALWITYTAIKEFWYDEKYETPIIRGSSLEDFLFQSGASIVAFVLTLIFN